MRISCEIGDVRNTLTRASRLPRSPQSDHRANLPLPRKHVGEEALMVTATSESVGAGARTAFTGRAGLPRNDKKSALRGCLVNDRRARALASFSSSWDRQSLLFVILTQARRSGRISAAPQDRDSLQHSREAAACASFEC